MNHLWQLAAGLGVGAFVASLFYGVISRFGTQKGSGFQVSQLGKEATAIIAVLIILIFGGITALALVIYAPSPRPIVATNSGNTSDSAPTSPPTVVALSWLAFVDAGHYDESWDQAATDLQASCDKDTWRQTLTSLQQPLGAPLSRLAISINPWAKKDGRYWSEVIYETHFANDTLPSRTEWVQMTATNATDAKVAGYRIFPAPIPSPTVH